MSVRFNQAESKIIKLCGGFPQGSLIGQDCYLGASHDAAEEVNPEDKFRYIDDLEILELIMMSGILVDYDVHQQVPSDIPIGTQYLPSSETKTQTHLDQLAAWTDRNKMLLNPAKSSYTIFSRSREKFVTRLTVNGTKLDQKEAVKILGCWIEEDAGKWGTNTKALCKSAYSRISMLSKLKYVGVHIEDLLEIYKLFIRSRAEYMSVLWHGNLTLAQEQKVENIQKTSLKVLLAENYVDYPAALEMTGIKKLFLRRQERSLTFATRCLKNPLSRNMFPLNPQIPHDIRNTEKYHVNFANTENYRNSAVPFCQRLLNMHESEKEQERRTQAEQERMSARTKERARTEERARTGERARTEG